MHPRPTKNETHTLAPNLNRGMTAGMKRVDVNAHLNDIGISHGTKQSLMRVNGRDRGTSQAHLETQERKAHGNSMITPRENDKLTLEQSALAPKVRTKSPSILPYGLTTKTCGPISSNSGTHGPRPSSIHVIT